MSRLRQIVEGHVVNPAHAGDAAPPRYDRAALQRELSRLRRSREMGFWVMFVLLALLFIGAGVAVFHYRSDPSKLRSLFAATGVTFMGVIAAMNRLWSQKVKTDLLIAIVMAMPEKPSQAVLTTLLEKL